MAVASNLSHHRHIPTSAESLLGYEEKLLAGLGDRSRG
jgi:hypothetical protein